jgi:outer membrane protein OmpA-like peptidoglycan-associated protein
MKTTGSKKNNNELSPATPFFNKGAENSFFSKDGGSDNTFFSATGIQASLTVGEPDDPFEKEADMISRQVVEGFESNNINPSTNGSRISRKSPVTKSTSPTIVQQKCSHCEEEERMQQKSGEIQFAGEGSPVSPNIENKINGMRGGGQAMDDTTRSAMENSIGADFSNVRVHANSQSVQMSKELNAHAFTVGNDIFFNENRYRPSSKEGMGLLAHELTHTVQQGSSLQNKSIMPAALNSGDDSISGSNTANNLLPPSKSAAENSKVFRQQIQTFRSADNAKRGSSYSENRSSNVGGHTKAPLLQKQDVLENDLGAASGLTCPVSTEKLPHENASLDITFNLGGTALTAEDITNIAVFVNNWHSSALSVPVRVHGFASIDGTPAINWPLSCNRAEAVSKQMQKVQPAVKLSTGKTFPAGTAGIPAGFIQVFAHGETDEFSKTSLLQNRRVTAHVPNIPALPTKLAKVPEAKLKTGPTYKPSGVAPLTTNTPTAKAATFTMAAEFENDPPNGVLATCGEIRQYIKWSNQNVDPSRFGHEGFLTDKTFIPDTWYEDRDQPNTRYGHRQGPHSAPIAVVDEYLNAKGVRDQLNGARYTGSDTPSVRGSVAFITSWVGTWEFRLEAIDTCNGNKVLGTDTVKVNW